MIELMLGQHNELIKELSDGDGQPLAGATVTATIAGTQLSVQMTETATAGRYEGQLLVQGLLPGRRTLRWHGTTGDDRPFEFREQLRVSWPQPERLVEED